MIVCIFKVLRALNGYLRYFLKMVWRIFVTQCWEAALIIEEMVEVV